MSRPAGYRPRPWWRAVVRSISRTHVCTPSQEGRTCGVVACARAAPPRHATQSPSTDDVLRLPSATGDGYSSFTRSSRDAARLAVERDCVRTHFGRASGDSGRDCVRKRHPSGRQLPSNEAVPDDLGRTSTVVGLLAVCSGAVQSEVGFEAHQRVARVRVCLAPAPARLTHREDGGGLPAGRLP